MRKRRLSRRRFLKGAASAGLAAALPTIVPSSVLGAGAPSNRIALGHIGCGSRSLGLTANFIRFADCRIVAACDPFTHRRQEKAARVNKTYGGNFCRAYRDFREMLAREDIDAVVIATPDHWHVPTALAAVRTGKDLFVEKPLGVAASWNFALRQEVRRRDVVFQYGTQQRSMGHMRRACELVRNGCIGRLRAVEVHSPASGAGGSTKPIPVPKGFDYDLWLGPAPYAPYTRDRCIRRGGYWVRDYSLGFIAGWGAHPLDIAVWGMGDKAEAVPVEYEGKGEFPTEGLYDTATRWDVRGRYANGVAFRFRGPGRDLTTFHGQKGTIRVARSWWRTDPPALKRVALGSNDLRLYVSQNHGRNFIDCVKRRRRTVSPVDVAVWSDTISHLSDIAIRTERKISWDPVKEVIRGDAHASRMLTRAMREPWSL